MEQQRIDDAKQAKINQENAVRLAEQTAADEARRVERERLNKERLDKKLADEKAADTAHQKVINNEALPGLIAVLGDEALSKKVLVAIITGKVAHVSVNY